MGDGFRIVFTKRLLFKAPQVGKVAPRVPPPPPPNNSSPPPPCSLPLRKAGQTRGLTGQLPTKASRPIHLKHFLISHQNLKGIVPLLTATLSILALHGNQFTLFKSTHWKSDNSAIALTHLNLLSCAPPSCGHVRTNFSLAALGNSMKRSFAGLPEWVSPMERDSLFWRSGTEGRSLLLRAMGAFGLLVFIVAVRFHRGWLLRVMSLWHLGTSWHLQLVSALSSLLVLIARQGFLRVFAFIFLLSWDYYKCPPALSLASVCLRDGTFDCLLVLVLWSRVYFVANRMDMVIPNGSVVTRESFTRAPLLCLLSLAMGVFIAAISIVYQAMKSVPGLGGVSELWSSVLQSCVGVAQGVLGGVVLPRLGKKLLANRLSYLMMMGLLTNCVLPAMVIAFLDAHCLGRWSAFWGPCRNRSEQFNRLASTPTGPVQVLSSLGLSGPNIYGPNRESPVTTSSTVNRRIML